MSEITDEQRLDWIQKHWFYESPYGGLAFSFNESWETSPHKTLRDAIDAEIAEAQEEQ